jgi:hypothetical protein
VPIAAYSMFLSYVLSDFKIVPNFHTHELCPFSRTWSMTCPPPNNLYCAPFVEQKESQLHRRQYTSISFHSIPFHPLPRALPIPVSYRTGPRCQHTNVLIQINLSIFQERLPRTACRMQQSKPWQETFRQGRNGVVKLGPAFDRTLPDASQDSAPTT